MIRAKWNKSVIANHVYIIIRNSPSRLSNDHLVADTGEGVPQIRFLETDGNPAPAVRRVLPHHGMRTTSLVRPVVFLRAVRWTCWRHRHSPSAVAADQPCVYRWGIEVHRPEEKRMRGRTVASSCTCHALSRRLVAVVFTGSHRHCWMLRGGRGVVVAIAMATSRIAVRPQVWRQLVRIGGRIHSSAQWDREPREKRLDQLWEGVNIGVVLSFIQELKSVKETINLCIPFFLWLFSPFSVALVTRPFIVKAITL